MKLKNYLNWFRFSGVWGGVVLNPYHWEPEIKVLTDRAEYGIIFFELNLGIAWIRIVIDDGRW